MRLTAFSFPSAVLLAGASILPAQETPRPVRNDIARAGEEFLVLRHQQLMKGAHERFFELSRDGVWPYFEKNGARIVGQWRRVYPTPEELDRRGTEVGAVESPEFDEVYMMARYASYEHWQATRPAVMARLGGNGPDYEACVEALERRRDLTLDTSVRFLRGHFYGSPPVYLPPLDETYRRVW